MTRDIRQFATRFCQAWAEAGRDLEAFMELFSEDACVELAVDESSLSAVSGPFDKASWRNQTRMESQVGDLNLNIQDVHGSASAVVIEAVGDILVAGEPYRNKYCLILKLDDDGKVRNLRIYLDTLHAEQVMRRLQASAEAVQWNNGK